MAGPPPPPIRQPYRMAVPPPPQRELSWRIFAVALAGCLILGTIIVAIVLNNNPFAASPTPQQNQTTGPQGSTITPTTQVDTPTPTPTPTATPVPQVVLAINAGAGPIGSFLGDTDFDMGNQFNDPNSSITMTDPNDTTPSYVYQSCHWNNTFNYTIPNLTPGTSYKVRLHWAELTFQQPGQRVFNVALNGVPVLTSFDVVATAGAWKTALTREFVTTADGTGRIVIGFTQAGPDNPFVSGIEIITV